MKIIRYINSQKLNTEKLPAMEIANPAVIQLIRRVVDKLNSCMA